MFQEGYDVNRQDAQIATSSTANSTPIKRLLISYAHPDDESFGLGALIGKYVEEGVEVYLICATNGDVGTVSPEMLNGYNSVAELRLAELDKATEILKFKRVYKLGFKDSGMMSSETISDPLCLWQKWQNSPDEVTRRVVEVIREIQPQVLITFNKYGGYGHPDHIAIQRATTEAFMLAGDSNYVTDDLPPYQPEKLYYSGIPTRVLRMAVAWLRLRGKDPRKLGRNADIDLQAILDYIEPTHTKISISKYYPIWDAASACHVSQGGGRMGFIPKWMRRWLAPYQGFTRVYPQPEREKVDEYDLFAGVQLD
jgi:N-acetyl-1-D-myo-inositol-2-amino-2-deoxy-alpha-D-glucopyranoside deacetylase/mycothiol S-conjugate amidase